MHLPVLIYDLALILLVAGLVSGLFRFLKQPTVLGYLVAGVLVGPQVKIFPTVGDPENIRAWGELGVIFLLFFLGLEFSFKKLASVGKPAAITAVFEVVTMGLIGFLTGKFLGWSVIDSIFLGAILSISSTTIIIKAFEESGVKSQLFASTVVGVLIIEDLLAILILAFLATYAVTQSFEETELLIQVGKLSGFLGFVVPFGLWFMPRLLRKTQPYMNDESRVVAAMGTCLGFVLLSTWIGFSAALGAFVIGAVMAETLEGERIERLMKPIKDLFAAVFFTSIGMLVNIFEIYSNLGVVLLITLVTVIGKFAMSTAGMQISGQDRKVSLQTGLSLAQIGEFSFIIATLGLTLNILRSDIYSITVAVSVLTTFLTPYLIRYASNLHVKSEKRKKRTHLPKLWDAHLVQLEVHPHFKGIGETLQQLRIREDYAVTIVAIYRGERKIISPQRNESLHAYDQLLVFGEDSKLKAFEHYLRSHRHEDIESDSRHTLVKWIIKEGSSLIGKSLSDSGLRERYHALVLGIERGQKKILNPLSTLKIEDGDILWIYGDQELAKDR